MNSNKRIAATVYSLRTLFVSGIYEQIPCIKEIMTIIIIIIIIITIIIIIMDQFYLTQLRYLVLSTMCYLLISV
jgi:hypothetical protein